MPEDTFLSEKNPVSHRWAVFEDGGLSAWLYLTEPDSEEIMADCWIYNRVQNPLPPNSYASEGIAPPAPADYIGGAAVMIAVDASNFRFVWSEDGESVSFLDGNSLLGFIAAGQKRGYSRNLNISDLAPISISPVRQWFEVNLKAKLSGNIGAFASEF